MTHSVGLSVLLRFWRTCKKSQISKKNVSSKQRHLSLTPKNIYIMCIYILYRMHSGSTHTEISFLFNVHLFYTHFHKVKVCLFFVRVKKGLLMYKIWWYSSFFIILHFISCHYRIESNIIVCLFSVVYANLFMPKETRSTGYIWLHTFLQGRGSWLFMYWSTLQHCCHHSLVHTKFHWKEAEGRLQFKCSRQ